MIDLNLVAKALKKDLTIFRDIKNKEVEDRLLKILNNFSYDDSIKKSVRQVIKNNFNKKDLIIFYRFIDDNKRILISNHSLFPNIFITNDTQKALEERRISTSKKENCSYCGEKLEDNNNEFCKDSNCEIFFYVGS